MGLRLNVDLDTNRGQTGEAYIKVETIRFNRVQTRVEFTTSCWVNKEAADAFDKKYVDDPLGSSVGLLTKEVVYYEDENDVKGTEVTIENYYTAEIYREIEVETPIYEEKEVTKLIPYVSFDENGDEVIKEKEVSKIEKVQVDSKKEIKKLVDFSLVDNIFDFAYQSLINELTSFFPKDKLQIVK